jgi:dTDP-4-dehydrorhamnose reductase
MKILITGARGRLGAELRRQLGDFAVGVDLPEFDLTDPDSVGQKIREVHPEIVINAAAYTQVDRAEEESFRCHVVNVTGVENLTEVCRELDIPLLQMSTDYVFCGNEPLGRPWRETDVPLPQGVYAVSKFHAERIVASWRKHFIVRTCGLYGHLGETARQSFTHKMLSFAARRKELRVVDDQICTPSYVPDVAKAIRFLLATRTYGLYHVVSGGQTTWYGFAKELCRQAEIDAEVIPISSAEYGGPAPRPRHSPLDTTRFHSLPRVPEIPHWKDALSRFLVEERAAVSRAVHR